MPRIIVNGRRQIKTWKCAQPFADRLFLRRPDLNDQVTARFEVVCRLLRDLLQRLEAARPAVQGQVRLIVADAYREFRQLLARDVWRVAQDEIETLARGNGIKPIAAEKADAVGN